MRWRARISAATPLLLLIICVNVMIFQSFLVVESFGKKLGTYIVNVAFLAIWHPNVRYEGACRSRVGNPEFTAQVVSIHNRTNAPVARSASRRAGTHAGEFRSNPGLGHPGL
jgi:hypothetical protein